MGKLDLNKIELPLTKKKFVKLRDAIRKGKVKWLDMSKDLMYSYQDYWKTHRPNSLNN